MEAASSIARLASPDLQIRTRAAEELFAQGRELVDPILAGWRREAELSALLYFPRPRVTDGVAVNAESFEKIRSANGNVALANVPPDQDAREFELHFGAIVRLDILTAQGRCRKRGYCAFSAEIWRRDPAS